MSAVENADTPTSTTTSAGQEPSVLAWVYAFSGVIGSAVMLVILWSLADPGLAIYDKPESTPVGWFWQAVTGSPSAFGANILRYLLVTLTVLSILLLWPLVCMLGVVVGNAIFVLISYTLQAMYLYPFFVLHTALFSLPLKWAYDHVPESLLNPHQLQRIRTQEAGKSFLVSFVVTGFVLWICVAS